MAALYVAGPAGVVVSGSASCAQDGHSWVVQRLLEKIDGRRTRREVQRAHAAWCIEHLGARPYAGEGGADEVSAALVRAVLAAGDARVLEGPADLPELSGVRGSWSPVQAEGPTGHLWLTLERRSVWGRAEEWLEARITRTGEVPSVWDAEEMVPECAGDVYGVTEPPAQVAVLESTRVQTDERVVQSLYYEMRAGFGITLRRHGVDTWSARED